MAGLVSLQQGSERPLPKLQGRTQDVGMPSTQNGAVSGEMRGVLQAAELARSLVDPIKTPYASYRAVTSGRYLG